MSHQTKSHHFSISPTVIRIFCTKLAQRAIITTPFELLLRIQTKCCGVSKHQMSGGYYAEHQQMMIKEEEDEENSFTTLPLAHFTNLPAELEPDTSGRSTGAQNHAPTLST